MYNFIHVDIYISLQKTRKQSYQNDTVIRLMLDWNRRPEAAPAPCPPNNNRIIFLFYKKYVNSITPGHLPTKGDMIRILNVRCNVRCSKWRIPKWR